MSCPFNSKRRLNRSRRLRASSLAETITASVIFLLIFVMAMDTLTRLLTSGGNDTEYVVLENELNRCRRQIAGSTLQPQEYTKTFDEGEIEVSITHYKENIYQIDLSVVGVARHRRIHYRYLQANP
ncbi:MAG: hypothetical protein LBM62_05185 [Mediterranea sp.]|jgi:hypothetical protein|nr:hypothetical protein [Mediterranea sp.]